MRDFYINRDNTFNPGGSFNNNNPSQADAIINESTRNQLTRIYPLRTGQATGDRGRPLAGFATLDVPNPISGTSYSRFTDDKGGQVYGPGNGSTANYVVDNETGYGWYRIPLSQTTQSAQITAAAAFTLGSYSDFFLPTWQELFSIVKTDSTARLDLTYSPFNQTNGLTYWTNTTSGSTGICLITNASNTVRNITSTSTNYGLIARIHFPII